MISLGIKEEQVLCYRIALALRTKPRYIQITSVWADEFDRRIVLVNYKYRTYRVAVDCNRVKEIAIVL